MESGRPAPRFSEGDLPIVLFACLQNVRRRPPIPLRNLGKGPGVTLPAGKITPGLINREIVFGTGKVNGRDFLRKTLIGSLEGRFASKGLCLVHLNQQLLVDNPAESNCISFL